VGQRDFIALESDFKRWAREISEKYNIFLEIQRGGWDSQKSLQRVKPEAKHFVDWVNAFDLLKIYGAGWLGEPGLAFGKNPPFSPGGSIFKRIVENDSFCDIDLYAAYQLHKVTQEIKFGRSAGKTAGGQINTRGMTKYLFIFVLIELLKDCMSYSQIEQTLINVSSAVIQLFSEKDSVASQQLIEAALNVIDDYLTSGNEDAVFTEPKYTGDINSFLKWDKLGKGTDSTPKLNNLIAFTKRDIRRSVGGQTTTRDVVCAVITHRMVING